MNVGIIGNGNHSKRIQKILRKKKINFFLYKPSKPKYFDKIEFEKLKLCRIIFIISPNSSHYDYIMKLHKNRYLFCEKPPVVKKHQLINIKKLNSKKIFFNFNYRFLKIAEILQNINKYSLGNLIYANLISSHGLALKKQYKSNWRSNIKKSPKGVFEIVSIHYIDLINYYFEVKKINKPKLLNFSKVGNSYDTSLVQLELKNKSLVNIFTTYNSALAKKFFFLFENGIIEQNGDILTISGPAMNLDKEGLFKKPKIKKYIKIKNKYDIKKSLDISVTFFLKIAMNKKTFDKKEFNCSIKSNSLIV